MSELVARAEVLLEELWREFPLRAKPKIVWKNTRVTAGTAYYKTWHIGLSRIVLDDEEKMRTTLIHEYAHLLAVDREGLKAASHGEAWKQAMLDLGQVPKVRHTYPVQRNQARQAVEYRCQKCGKTFTRGRRLSSRRKYVHANCGGGLKLVDIKAITQDSVTRREK